jgi:hypothetical protein
MLMIAKGLPIFFCRTCGRRKWPVEKRFGPGSAQGLTDKGRAADAAFKSTLERVPFRWYYADTHLATKHLLGILSRATIFRRAESVLPSAHFGVRRCRGASQRSDIPVRSIRGSSGVGLSVRLALDETRQLSGEEAFREAMLLRRNLSGAHLSVQLSPRRGRRMNIGKCTLLSMVITIGSASAQTGPSTLVEKATRDATIDTLVQKVASGYVLPENADRIVQALRSANRAGAYNGKTPRDFADAVNRTLLSASHDKHLKVFYQPVAVSAAVAGESVSQKERFNYGFDKLERLRGNIAFLEIASFADLTQQSAETTSALLSTLANFDAVIIDLRRNGGGSTPMMAFVATYFFEPTPVHLTDIYWRDTNQTSQFWSDAFVPGKRSSHQPLYILTSAQTFSSAEDFCYSLQSLNRAVLVGETTGGGAHSGRGLQQLSDSFTAFIPVGRSLSPITKTNWEGTGITPDVKTSAEASVGVATELALKALIDTEPDAQWKQGLQQTVDDLLESRH